MPLRPTLARSKRLFKSALRRDKSETVPLNLAARGIHKLTNAFLLAAFQRPGVILTSRRHAQVVELVDTQVSEACALTAWRFESSPGHHNLIIHSG
jgi:hypothetical protein